MSDNITAIRPSWEIIHGDALKVLCEFAPNTFDAVITDPPYASGGRTQAEKNKSTDKKYSSMGESAPPPFDGDSKDQRSWTRWATEWLYDARKVCKPGVPVCMFIDWRQLPAATDALQWAEWIWCGTAVWNKCNSRPQKGPTSKLSTLSAVLEGYSATGIEVTDAYAALSKERIARELAQSA